MPRGYRCIVLAAFGWLILAAGPPPKGNYGEREQPQTERQIADALNSIDATLKKPSKADVTTQPCKNGEDRRDSDLCAQWKAADAASWATKAAWIFGVVGCLIGGATLVAAIQAAKWARRAAEETERGADAAELALKDTRQTNELLVRPYIAIVALEADLEMKLDWSPKGFIRFGIKNFGQVPSKDVTIFSGSDLFAPPIGDENVEDLPIKNSVGPVHPGETITTTLYFAPLPPDVFKAVRSGACAWVARICVEYVLPDGTKDQVDVSSVVSKYLLEQGRGMNRLTDEDRQRL